MLLIIHFLILIGILFTEKVEAKEDCLKPIGLKDGRILDSQITGSSYKKGFPPHKARLDGPSCWIPDMASSNEESISIDFNGEYKVAAYDIQGGRGAQMQFFGMAYLTPKRKWITLKNSLPFMQQSGNQVIPLTEKPLVHLRGIRFLLRKNVIGQPCFRFEVYGCKVKTTTAKPPIDYCSLNNTCNQICRNGITRAICYCRQGYTLVNGKCEDTNECSRGEDRCDVRTTLCVNTLGSYKCKCNDDGLKLAQFGLKCIDRNECNENNGGCDQSCTNSHKSYKCSCRDGYVLDSDLHTCNDINECLSSNNRCDNNTSTCMNKPGSYRCECLSGLKVKTDDSKNFVCEDINECDVRNGGCDHECHNTIRSYYCTCRSNTELNADGRRCDDINECTRGTHDCEQKCFNHYASYSCACEDGYKLQPDQKSCKDVNECTANNGRGPCEHRCKNTMGSFQCSCNDGYKLSTDQKACVDEDECAARTDKCDYSTSTCVNTPGSYECRCKPGYKKDATGQCFAKKCPALPVIQNGSINPPDCSSASAKQFKDVCSFKCDAGYKLNMNSAKLAYCNQDGLWDLRGSGMPICEKIQCSQISNIPNGQIVPSSCENRGVKYGESCTLYCNIGFRLVGTKTVTCMDNKQYDQSFDQSKCLKKRRIVCPSDVSMVLPLGAANTILPTAKLSIQLDTEKYITEPAGVLTGLYKFKPQAQSHPVKLKYKDNLALSSDTESCIFHVTVTDREPPVVKNCPANDNYFIISGSTGRVSWSEPEFTDNVGVVKRLQNTENNQLLPQQVYFVLYEARDASGNEASCRFFVHVKAKFCAKDTMPGGEDSMKTWFGTASTTSLQVFLKCPSQMTFSSNLTTVGIFVCTNGEWKGPPIPDCVPYTMKNGSCSDDETTLKTINGNIVCGKCPKGTMGNGGICTPCKKGFYQDSIGKLSCKPCPKDTTSIIEGAKDVSSCKALCQPGTYSLEGFYGSSGCEQCPSGSYQDMVGKTSCKLCPNGAESFKGSTSERDCTSAPRITKIVPSSESVTAKDGDTIIVECFATGSPKPFIKFVSTTKLPPDGFRGKKTIKPISSNNKLEYGMRMIIEKATSYDTAIYRCEADNTRGPLGGSDVREIYIKVE